MTEAACFTYSVINSFYYFTDRMSLKTKAQLILNNIILESPIDLFYNTSLDSIYSTFYTSLTNLILKW